MEIHLSDRLYYLISAIRNVCGFFGWILCFLSRRNIGRFRWVFWLVDMSNSENDMSKMAFACTQEQTFGWCRCVYVKQSVSSYSHSRIFSRRTNKRQQNVVKHRLSGRINIWHSFLRLALHLRPQFLFLFISDGRAWAQMRKPIHSLSLITIMWTMKSTPVNIFMLSSDAIQGWCFSAQYFLVVAIVVVSFEVVALIVFGEKGASATWSVYGSFFSWCILCLYTLAA